MPSTRSASKKSASKQPQESKEDTKSTSSSKKIQKTKSFYAEAIYAIYSSQEDENYFLAKLLEQGTKPNKAAKGIYLEKIGQKQGVATYNEGDEITVNTEDILTELEYSTKKAGTKKKAETHYLIEVDEIESKGVKSKAKLHKGSDDNNKSKEEEKTPVKKGKASAKKKEEPVEPEEEESEEEEEEEEGDEEEVKEEKGKKETTPRKIKKAVGRKSNNKEQNGEEIEVEEYKGVGRRSLRTRKDKSKKDEEEEENVSRVSKKQKGSTTKAKGTKKEVLDEPEEEEENVEKDETSSSEDDEEDEGTKKKKKKDELEQEEESDTTDEESEEEQKPKKGRGRPKGSGKKKAKDESEESEAEEAKPKGKRGRPKKGEEKTSQAKEKKKGKETAKFKRGKFNNNVEIIDICEMLQSPSDHVIDYESVKSNNKNLIRAVYTENYKLLDEILTKDSFTSNLFQPWGSETDFNALEIAFKNNDKHAITKILECVRKNELKMAREPPIGLKKIDTGYVSEYTFGVRVRKVAAARGGREGNNAFIADTNQSSSFSGCVDKIVKYDFDPELFDTLRLQLGDYTAIGMFQKVVLAGNRRLATHVAEYADKVGGWNFGFLHVEALKCNTVEEMSQKIMAISVTKKTLGFDGITPLHLAAINPNKEILKHLFDIFPNYSFADNRGRKPVHFAACCEGTGPLELLLEFGVDINEPEQNGLTPLMYAAYNGRAENVKLLLEQARIVRDYKMKDRTAGIHWAALRGHVEVLKIFKEKGADMNLKGRLGMTPLMLAAAYGHFDCVEFLLANGGKINTRDRMKRNALVLAVKNGNLKIASYLLKNGSDFDKPDSSDNFAMHYAAAYGFPECITLLIKAGADCNAINSWNLTPLAVAMLKNNFHCVKTLLALPNININCKDEDGRTLISQTILELTRPTFEHLKFLVLEKKADMSIVDREGLGPLHHACNLDTLKMAKRNYNFNDLTEEERNDAQKECLQLKLEVVEFLIESGADINQKSEDGELPIHFAFRSGHETIINKLLDQPNIDLLSANKSSGTIYNYLDFSNHSYAFQLFDKILARTGNQKNILNNKIVVENGVEYSEQNILSLYLKSFITAGSQVYDQHYEKKKAAWIAQYRIQNDLRPHQHVSVTFEAGKEFTKEAKAAQEKFIQDAIAVLEKLVEQGCEIPSKPYPLYQTYNSSSHPFIIWIFKNFDKKICDFNAKETVGERPVSTPKEGEESTNKIESKEKTIIHYLVESLPSLKNGESSRYKDLKDHLKKSLEKNASEFRGLLELFHQNNVDFQVKTRDEKTPALIFTDLSVNEQPARMFELFKDLDHYKVDVSSADKEGNTAILDAARRSWTEIVEYLAKERRADINVRNEKGNTVLHYYVEKKDAEGVERVIKVGANPEITDLEGRTPLHLAINRTLPEDMFEVEGVLLRNGANVNAKDNLGRTPLHYSFLTRDGKQQQGTHHDAVECVASLCDVENVNIDIRDARGKTALHYASATGAYGSVMFLLNKKASVDIKDVDGNTALALALYRGHKELASILIQNGASVHNKLEVIVEEKVLKGAHKMKNVARPKVEEEDGDEMSVEEEEEEKGEKNGGKMEEEEETERLENWGHRGEILPGAQVRSSFFALAIRKNWLGVAYLLLQSGYNLMEAIKDGLMEEEFRYVLALIHKAMSDDILKHKDENGRNLFHIFAKKRSAATNNYEEKTFQQLLKRGVEYNAQDIDKKTPLHYAAQEGYRFLEYELLKLGTDPNVQDNSGLTPLATSLVNNQLNKVKLGEYHRHKADITKKFSFKLRDKTMQIGPIIYLTSQGDINKELLQEFISLGASVNETDEDGWTGLIYAIRQNSLEMVQHFLSFPELDTELVDSQGKTPIHHVVNPLEYGSYENVEMLRLLSTRFDVNKADKRGKAPIFYAYQQDSGVMIQALKEVKAKDIQQQKGMIKRQATSIIASESWPEEVDYEGDAEKYVEEAKEKEMEEQEEETVEPDEFANNAENLEVVKDEKLGAYSLYMTKVNVRKGGYGEYLFYRMQVLHEKNRDVYILFTRWGRIGEDGGYQNTPFSTKEKCIAEFKKIFFEKSRNQWDDKENFQRVPGKYRLLDLDNQKKVYRREYLKQIDFEDKSLGVSKLAPEIQGLLKVLANVNIYKRNFENLSIDSDLLPFGRISKELIFEARGLLTEIAALIDESDKASKEKDIDIPKILKFKEEIAEKSSRFYELIPNTEFHDSPVAPIDSKSLLSKQSWMVDSLLDYEVTSKILLGALYNLKKVHPLDYCFNALSIKLLPLSNEHPEYQLIKQYIKNGYERNFNESCIQGIFAIERKGEVERISQWRHLKNRMYLWHGSKISNIMSIFNQGLRIAPAEAESTGALFGKGIYFADMISKSLNYSRDYAAEREKVNVKTVLLCEVALGESLELFEPTNIEELDDQYKSVIRRGSQGPNMDQQVVLVNGARVPIGKVKPIEHWKEEDGKRRRVYLYNSHSEYIVYDVSQVRMRYVVQLK